MQIKLKYKSGAGYVEMGGGVGSGGGN